MEGLFWTIVLSYLITGMYYYCFSINRIVSFITRMNERGMLYAVTLCIFLLTLILVWPYYVSLDWKDKENDG